MRALSRFLPLAGLFLIAACTTGGGSHGVVVHQQAAVHPAKSG